MLEAKHSNKPRMIIYGALIICHYLLTILGMHILLCGVYITTVEVCTIPAGHFLPQGYYEWYPTR